jgi:hypothetical protein
MGQAKLRKAEIIELRAKGSRVKELGQVFTPFPLVKQMLDALDSTFKLPVNELKWKTILEPSCGNGQFVLGVIRKLMDAYEPHWNEFSNTKDGWEIMALRHILEVQLFAVELDQLQLEVCISRIKEMIRAYGADVLADIDFNHNIICGDAIKLDLGKAFFSNMATWKQPFIAVTSMQLDAACKFKLSAIVIDSMFKPSELDAIQTLFTKAKKAA